MVALFVLAMFLTILTLDLAVLKFRGKNHPAFEPSFSGQDLLIFDGNNFSVPPGIFLSKGHTWLKKNEGGVIDVGVDPLGAMVLGKSPDLQFAGEGRTLRRGEVIFEGTVEGQIIKFLSPVNGIVKSVNPDFSGNLISDPYGRWGLRIISNDLEENRRRYLSGNGALSWMKKEFIKLKRFIDLRSPGLELAGATMYDGGILSGETVSSFAYLNAKDFEKEFLSL